LGLLIKLVSPSNEKKLNVIVEDLEVKDSNSNKFDDKRNSLNKSENKDKPEKKKKIIKKKKIKSSTVDLIKTKLISKKSKVELTQLI
jgi:hypothetical protein